MIDSWTAGIPNTIVKSEERKASNVLKLVIIVSRQYYPWLRKRPDHTILSLCSNEWTMNISQTALQSGLLTSSSTCECYVCCYRLVSFYPCYFFQLYFPEEAHGNTLCPGLPVFLSYGPYMAWGRHWQTKCFKCKNEYPCWWVQTHLPLSELSLCFKSALLLVYKDRP